METAKKKVVSWALDELEVGRNKVNGIGWVDITEQPDVAVVYSLDELLGNPAAHQFIASIELTESASTHLREGGKIPGLMLAAIEPSVRMSVKEYIDNLGKYQLGETNE